MDTIIKLHCPSGADALASTMEGEVGQILLANGLLITDKGIEFPQQIINSLLWRVRMECEVLNEEGDSNTKKAKALQRLAGTLIERGAHDKLEFNDDGVFVGQA